MEGSQVLNSQELILSITFLTIAPSAAGFVRGDQMIMVARRKALQVYAALTTAVYRKTMKLSSAGKASVETGQIINMLTQMRPMLWSSPFSNCSTHNGNSYHGSGLGFALLHHWSVNVCWLRFPSHHNSEFEDFSHGGALVPKP